MIPWFLTSRIGRALGTAVAFLLAVVTFGLWNRRQERKQAKAKDNAEYIETRKEMDDAEIHGDDPDAARRWLSERKRRGDL